MRLALIAALPWLLAPLVVLWRARGSRSLDDVDDAPPADAPLVSVVVPARNERRNVERCLRSVLSTRYPSLEVILVDDHSDDGTGGIARAIAREDPRLRVVENRPLPAGWFGKQWACATGAESARGALLLFVDADTTHGPDLVPRAVNAMRAWSADMLSVAGWQEMGTFWERLVQPQVFSVIFARYGGTEGVNRARRAEDMIANGQFILITREAYARVGGHAAVRDKVAEDLMLAQTLHRAGARVRLALGMEQLSTRMYTSFAELVHGWGKNIYAGAIDAIPGGVVGRLVFPLLLLAASVHQLLPVALLLLAIAGIVPGALLWSAVVSGALLAWWLLVYGWLEEPLWYALLFPLGAAAFLVISLRAIARGRRVEWRGREYRAA